jgi:hypothetical protein
LRAFSRKDKEVVRKLKFPDNLNVHLDCIAIMLSSYEDRNIVKELKNEKTLVVFLPDSGHYYGNGLPVSSGTRSGARSSSRPDQHAGVAE